MINSRGGGEGLPIIIFNLKYSLEVLRNGAILRDNVKSTRTDPQVVIDLWKSLALPCAVKQSKQTEKSRLHAN